MPGFIAEMVARGFWWAILATAVVQLPFTIGFQIASKAFGFHNKVFSTIFTSLPGSLFWFYIWHIRSHVGWLIFAIIGCVFCLISTVILIKNKQ
jgi:hypothetical protein